MLYNLPTHNEPLLEGIVLGHMTSRPGKKQALKKESLLEELRSYHKYAEWIQYLLFSEQWEPENYSLPVYDLDY